MSTRPHPLRWVPAFLVGLCAATAAEVAVGLLLYSGPGLVRSLTTVLTVEAAAFGVGLWTAPGPRPELPGSLRRRWLLCLVAFLAATVFTAFWSVVQVMGGGGLGQGLGLALVGGLPLYACGGVLGGMAAANVGDPSGGRTPTGAPAFLGAAAGAGVTGISLLHVLTPASLLLVCLVLLSAAGLVHGTVLDTHLSVHVRARRGTATGDVRIEDRRLLSGEGAARFVLERDHVRRWIPLGEEKAPASWDVAAFRVLVTEDESPCRVLLLGGGASALPRIVAEEHLSVLLDVIERTQDVLELAREHMDVDLPAGDDAHTCFHVGNTSDLVEALEGPYHLILVDTAAYDAVGGVIGLSRHVRDLLWSRLEPTGALAVGPAAPGEGVFSSPMGWTHARYRRAVATGVDALKTSLRAEEVVLVVRPSSSGAFPPEFDGFVPERDSDAGVAQRTEEEADAR